MYKVSELLVRENIADVYSRDIAMKYSPIST